MLTARPALRVVAAAAFTLIASSVNAQPTGARFDVVEISIADLQAALTTGRVTSAQLVDAYLTRIRTYDPTLNSVLRLNPNARAEAAQLDEERARGAVRGPLHGIPILLKDNYDTRDMPTSGSTIALAGSIAPDDATSVRKLREAGAVIIGKTNLHELAAGITSISSLGGQTRNPYDPSRNPGGSSGGTGAAVAASFAAIGYGSDTCGSIRIPAVFNALFGLRPTKGLTSVDGVIPLSHTQDVVGPLARTVGDLAIGLDAVMGLDAADPATQILRGRTVPRFADALRVDALRGVRIGVLTSYFGDTAEDKEVGDLVRLALDRIRQQGAEVVDIALPTIDSLLAGTSVIDYEFKFDLIDYLARTPAAPIDSLGDILNRGLHHIALDPQFRRRNATATRESDVYRRARERQAALRDTMLVLLQRERLDALAYPTVRRKPAPVSEMQRGTNCQLASSTGLPALAMPAGFTTDGLPIGLELLGRPLEDAKLVAFAYAYEQAVKPRRPPALTAPTTFSYQPATSPINVVDAAVNAAIPELRARFSWNRAAREVRYDLQIPDMQPDRLHAIAIQRSIPNGNSAILYRLAGPGALTAAGSIILSNEEMQDLLEGRLFLTVFTADLPLGAARFQLRTQ